MAANANEMSQVPVILLKTKSTPADAYEETLASFQFPKDTIYGSFDPFFVPVFEHRVNGEGIKVMCSLLQNQKISQNRNAKYGGMIFTSQRAVEAFSQVVHDIEENNDMWPHLQSIPVYSVGPATTRALRAIHHEASLQIFGEQTGNGEALARYILEHYKSWYSGCDNLPPLLFPVGEQRRDVIPRTLMDPDLASDRRIQVDEIVVYVTGVMESFPVKFGNILAKTGPAKERWVVVFSPTGCDSMLRGLGLLNDSGKAKLNSRDGKTFIVTIGATTKSYLKAEFGFNPDVCAEAPSPEGVLKAIIDFSSRRGS